MSSSSNVVVFPPRAPDGLDELQRARAAIAEEFGRFDSNFDALIRQLADNRRATDALVAMRGAGPAPAFQF